MKFSLLPLLVTGQSISAEIRKALGENRLQDAAREIMREYGLNCVETAYLLDIAVCEEN